jgi:hypothetical protein
MFYATTTSHNLTHLCQSTILEDFCTSSSGSNGEILLKFDETWVIPSLVGVDWLGTPMEKSKTSDS